MKRLFWLGMGVAVGALVVRAVSKRARSYTPSGLASGARDSARNLFDSVQAFVDDVRDGMHERERELQAAIVDGADLEALLEERFDDADVPTRTPPEDITR
jgi:hypothetical protein